MADANDSDSSALSEHSDHEVAKLAPIFLKAKKVPIQIPKVSPPRQKRPPSPPHEETLADHPAIPFIVMFRSRFTDVMPSKLPHFGPQDVERGVSDSAPSHEVQQLLCAILGLVLNRKKPVERGHHGRALEEALLSHKSQWPRRWNGLNPLHGGNTFENMSPQERLDLLRTLIIWSLSSSEAVSGMIKEKYKQQRHNDDLNQPLSVQPWGSDGDKRQYYLIQGLDDTSFRVYREASRHTRNATWYNQAGTIDEVKGLATKLEQVDGHQIARKFANRINAAVPTFEASEDKRRKREQRREQRARFTRPEPGFSLYEGRTRGKRLRYTYDDDEDIDSDATSNRRSARQSARSTPFETGPTVTLSGRQVRQPRTGGYGESLLSGPPISTDELAPEYSDPERAMSRARSGRMTRSGTEDSEPVRGSGRPTRSGLNGRSNPRKRAYNDIDGMSDEEDAEPSGDEWDSDKNDDDEQMPDASEGEDDMSDADDESQDDDVEPKSLVVKLRLPKKGAQQTTETKNENGSITPPLEMGEAMQVEAPKPESDRVQERVAAASMPFPATNGVKHAMSSPNGPSSYPTPTSTSFQAPDPKHAVAPPMTDPASRFSQGGSIVYTNGVSASAGAQSADVTGTMPSH